MVAGDCHTLRQPGMRHGKIGVKFNRPLKKPNAQCVSIFSDTHAVVFQGLEGRCCGFNRNIKLLHGLERLSQLGAQTGRGSTQNLQNIFLAGGLRLLFGQGVARVARDRIQVNQIVAAQAGDRPSQHGLAAGAQTKLPPYICRYALVRRTTHHLQGLADFSVGEQVQEGRLP